MSPPRSLTTHRLPKRLSSLPRIATLLTIMTVSVPAATLSPTHLRTEYRTNPLGVDSPRPRLYWQLQSTAPNTHQIAYEIRTAATLGDLSAAKSPRWKSGRVDSDRTTHIVYEGPALVSREVMHWQVRVWDNHGHVSAWSEPARWEMGLLEPSDWSADWIEAAIDEDTSISNPAQYFRRDFALTKPIASARLYITSHGVYEASLNGQRIGEDLLTPGWTSYAHRLPYQVHDVTALLVEGDNTLGALVGDGWWRGQMGWGGKRNNYGEKLALISQLEITHSDGSITRIGTDPTWRAATGAILFSDLYNGESYDARLFPDGWNRPGFNATSWTGAVVRDHPKSNLIATVNDPMRRIEEITPVNVTPLGDDRWLYDLGQNMVGWVRLKTTGQPGETFVLRHAEVLTPDGKLYTENLRSAQQTVHYTRHGDGDETYEPHFTLQGFRYVELTAPNPPVPDAITGIVIHSDLRPTGQFTSSDEMLNQLQSNIVWGMKGNFVDVPTDCPQRDERLGWTGDTQVFAPTASFLMDTAAFYTKWTGDVMADQETDGSIPNVIPKVLKEGGVAGWADAAVIVPWTVYLNFGDKRILETNYTCMRNWVEKVRRETGDNLIVNGSGHFGDWLFFKTSKWNVQDAITDKDLIATAYFARSTALLAKTARVLGHESDAATYAVLSRQIKTGFQREFITPGARLMSDTQTAYVLALGFDLVPPAQQAAVAAHLAANVRQYGHLTTGFLGTPLLTDTLSENGYTDLAFELLMRRDYPSWLYPVTRGATTIWERWDGIKEDGSFQNRGMNSFNHYAYGAVGDWIYRTIGGIQSTSPGYRTVRIAPVPGGGLTHANTSFESLHGRISSAWRIADGVFALEVTVPPNTTAAVVVPHPGDSAPITVDAGTGSTPTPTTHADGHTTYEVGSGTYRFRTPWHDA
ncbi:glycoside hydrolase family 78 protein [Synoicihabitans lomoniglobus]|uniref:alpha-L-rhamnosidase n=1 Tax=Synoicihabitans lomoniglobus TaxID=2909285 RepID=A0AAF0CQ21_9BACT|nr:glycoside hydrolase family 78 protein [Opitutaceae bacterium LMO-M01]WED65958.1 glycoside hydrolase family 78 protein [Opitutaceae bacterium LMO-M01]